MWVAEQLGVSRQSVSMAGTRALNPQYRGDMLRPDAVMDGRPLWIRDKIVQWIDAKKETKD